MDLRVISMPALLRPPLRHRADVSRNVEAGRSPTNQPLPRRLEPIAAELRCHYWEPERTADRDHAGLREGPNVVVVALGPRMLVQTDADLRIGDVVTEVRAGSQVITDQAMRCMELLWRSTHQEAGFELLSGGPVVEAGS